MSYSASAGTNTGDMSSGVITDALKQIDEELKITGEEAQNLENKNKKNAFKKHKINKQD